MIEIDSKTMLVMCNGMGRSGSTYQYNLSRLFVETTGKGDAHGFVFAEAEHHSLSVPDEQFAHWAKSDSYELVKIHVVHPLLQEFLEANLARVLYIYRDIRDVAVSLTCVFGIRGDPLLDRLDGHVRSYRTLGRLRELFPGYFLWQRYEDVMQDPGASAEHIRDFLEVLLHDETFQDILEKCSTDSMKAVCDRMQSDLRAKVDRVKTRDPHLAAKYLREIGRGSREGSVMYQLADALLMYNHISRDKGASGVWQTALTASQVAVLHDRYGSWLLEAGYEM